MAPAAQGVGRPRTWVDQQLRKNKLRDMRVSRLTLFRYRDAVQSFLFSEHNTFGGCSQDLETLDDHAVAYIEALWEECEAKTCATQALAGIQHFLQRRRCLPRSWFLVETWNNHEMPGRALPLPTTVVYSLVGKALYENNLGLAAALALAFAAFLRTGEMLAVQLQHIAIVDARGTVALPLTKMGKRRGLQEMFAFEDPIAIKLILAAARSRHPGDPLMPSPSVFRQWWKSSVTELGLDAEAFRPYGLRRGGATEFLSAVQGRSKQRCSAGDGPR